MSDKEATVEATGMVLDKLDQYMQAAQDVITKYGGDAVDLGLTVLRIEAIAETLTMIALVLMYVFVYKKATPLWEEGVLDNIGDPKSMKHLVWGMVAPAVSAISLLPIMLTGVFSIWPITGIFWPEAYAVHKFLLGG